MFIEPNHLLGPSPRADEGTGIHGTILVKSSTNRLLKKAIFLYISALSPCGRGWRAAPGEGAFVTILGNTQ
jgi:hypothetical protein